MNDYPNCDNGESSTSPSQEFDALCHEDADENSSSDRAVAIERALSFSEAIREKKGQR